MINFKELIDKYNNNIIEQMDLDNTLFETQSKSEWSENLTKRAKRLQAINKENTEIIKIIKAEIQNELTDDVALELYELSLGFINTGICDAELNLPILRKLNYYYKKKNDIPKRVTCLYFIGYLESELLFRSGAIERPSGSWDKEIISMKDHYPEIEDMITRSYFLMSYYNRAVASVSGPESYDESYKWYQEFLNFVNSETYLSVDKDNKDFDQYILMFKRHWLQFVFTKEDKDRPVCKVFCKQAEEAYDLMYKKVNGDKTKIEFQTLYAHLIAQIVEGNMTFTEATHEYYNNKYQAIMTLAETKTDQEFITYAVLPINGFMMDLAYHIENTRLRKSYFDLIYDALLRVQGLNKQDIAINSLINQSLSSLCIKTISCMNNKAEKEDKIFNLVIKRQLSTYIHSSMVASLARIIVDEVYDKKPKLFEKTGMDYGAILHFTEQAALLHDLGKIQITDIINMQRRQLCDEEFSGVKRHPELGAEIVKSDPDLAIYYDIMIGHHKFYDGHGGYPTSFDNTKSKYQIIIDIITIADCMDAATDSYSRNYKEAISFEKVLSEFLQEAGTRYNPDVVRLIVSSPELKFRLKKIAMKYRLDMMYQAYSSGKEKYIL